jgi:DNA-binding NarL/FixJ family response regulator
LRRLIVRRRERDDALKRMAKLTRREREVLALVAQGADNDAIAQVLVISPETARTHIQNVLGKLSVHSRLEAAAFVTQNGILSDLEGASST